MWWPSISSGGLPYFYNEDEAHHFNRVVNMVKRGDYNPHYFLKPSLHFYLRMPVVAVSFLNEVREGRARLISDVVTSDPHGIGGYALASSHPGMVKANRLFSVTLMAGALGVALFIISLLNASALLPLIGTCLVWLLSPALLAEAPVIGVDSPMTFFAGTCLLGSLLYVLSGHRGALITSVIGAGAAIGSKYNALPIIFLPLVALLARRPINFSPLALIFVLFGPWVVFICSSPYLVSELPLFLNHVAYELWHYGIAGHEGHDGEPGLSQLFFYLRWWGKSGVGIVAALIAVTGSISSLVKNPRLGIVFLFFPVLYLWLMSMQRANFERNMLVLFPWFIVSIGFGLTVIRKRLPIFMTYLLILLVVIEQAGAVLRVRAEKRNTVETRELFNEWYLKSANHALEDAAVDPALRFAPSVLRIPGVTLKKTDSLEMSKYEGFSWVVSHIPFAEGNGWKLEKKFEGIDGAQRITRNPSIYVYRDISSNDGCPDRVLTEECIPEKGQDYCWISNRLGKIRMANPAQLSLFSPWQDQQVTIRSAKSLFGDNFVKVSLVSGEWKIVALDKLKLSAGDDVFVCPIRVSSPQERGISADHRRLGVAVKHSAP
jgi:hypothetical protein